MPKVTAPALPHWDTLNDLDRKGLAATWQQAFDRPIPPRLYKNTVVMLLGYRLQELKLGGLSLATRRHLASLLRRLRPSREELRFLTALLARLTRDSAASRTRS